MNNFICIFVGLYLVFDSCYLAAKSDKEQRSCMIAKYVGAAMSGAYLVFIATKDLLFCYGVLSSPHTRFINGDAMQVLLLFGVTIAFFMWPETFWRGVGYLQINKPHWHQWLISNFKIHSRRTTDRKTT